MVTFSYAGIGPAAAAANRCAWRHQWRHPASPTNRRSAWCHGDEFNTIGMRVIQAFGVRPRPSWEASPSVMDTSFPLGRCHDLQLLCSPMLFALVSISAVDAIFLSPSDVLVSESLSLPLVSLFSSIRRVVVMQPNWSWERVIATYFPASHQSEPISMLDKWLLTMSRPILQNLRVISNLK